MTATAWIRGPWWDGFFILSALPIGCAAMLIPAPLMKFSVIYFLVLLQMAHSVSPYVLAWTHPEFRQMMLRRKRKYIGLPLLVMLAAVVTGAVSEMYFAEVKFFDDITDTFQIKSLYNWDALYSPAWWLLVLYIVWNTFHFAKQNFGVMSIYQRLSRTKFPANQRRLDYWFCMITPFMTGASVFVVLGPDFRQLEFKISLILLMVCSAVLLREAAMTGQWHSPRLMFAFSQTMALVLAGPLLWAVGSINHWLVAIGLSSHVAGRRFSFSPLIASGTVIVIGTVVFFVLFHRAGAWDWNLRAMIQITTFTACLRAGTGIVHFLYDRWIWRLSDPQVRTTIGKDLLGEPMRYQNNITTLRAAR